MLIDFHTHAFPDALASRAMSSLGERVDFTPTSDGTVSGLIKIMGRTARIRDSRRKFA